MKEKINIVLGILLSSIFGWTLGFLRLPFLESNFSFFLGFITFLSLVIIGLVLVFAWNKNRLLLRSINKGNQTKDSQPATKFHTLTWMLIFALILTGGAVSSYLIFKQNEFQKNQAQLLREKINEQKAILESTRKSNLVVLMNNLFNSIDEELKDMPDRRLSEETIARIAVLSQSFQPYRSLKGDSLSRKKLSPERGQLLLLLAALNIDSNSFNEIKRQTSFAGADLEGADLSGVDFSGAHLREANLKEVDLSNADLSRADLRNANLWGSNLTNAVLTRAGLEKADLSWTFLQGADLREANLNATTMTSAKMTGVELSKATMTYADLSDVFLNKAILKDIETTGTNFKSANLTEAVFTGAKMKVVNLTDAVLDKTNLEEVDLSGAIVGDKNWFEKLNQWQVKGGKTIQKAYYVALDTTELYSIPNKIRVFSF